MIYFQNYPKDLTDNISHPIEIAESFRAGSSIGGPFDINYTIEGLVKLLMYGDYVKAKASFQNAQYQSIIEDDVARYEYKRKNIIKVAQIANIIKLK